MDPVTAVGLASAILTFVEAGLKLIKTAHGIQNSVDGILDENRHRESIAVEVKQATTRLEPTATSSCLTPEQQSLCDLAKKCRETSTELVTVLEKVKPKPSPSNAIRSLKYALKASKKVDEIKNLESRLKDYRDQLTLALVELSKAESTDGFKKMLSLVKDNETKLESLTQAVEHLRQAHSSVTNTQAYSNFQQLLTIDSQARCAIWQDRILNSLKFEEKHSRYETVHAAHENTFNWIYKPIDREVPDKAYDAWVSQGILQMQCESREKFIGWLSSNVPPSPIFHISGKLGSGKSTLMKNLCSHPRTVEELEKWAGTNKLVFASFFFWRNGTKSQKSLAGLCRSLLHDILQERPDLISSTFPQQWSKIKQAPWMIDSKLEISNTSIKDALSRLLQNPHLYYKHYFCFFIDGLDEFEPGLQDGLDYSDLVGILRRWTTNANGNLKLCVSSREEGVFMEEYADGPNFRLQDLTRFDMEDYVRSRLSGLKNKILRENFITLIPKKSSGIFLWVYLVVKTIRTKMSHKVSDRVLEKHLETLPEGLKELFQHVLQNLEPDDRIWTLRVMDLLQAAKSRDMEFTLLASSLLEEYDRDPGFSTRDNIDELWTDQDVLRAQLRGACGGLVECHKSYISTDTLDFVHRSVPDMFQMNTGSTELSLEMQHARNGTDTIDVLMHVCFAVVRILRNDYWGGHMSQLRTIVLVYLEQRSNQPPYYFLEFLNTWLNNTWNKNALLDTSSSTWRLSVSNPFSFKTTLISHPSNNKISFFNTMMIALGTDRNDYVEWKLQDSPTILDTPLKRALVGWNILSSRYWKLFFNTDMFLLDTLVPVFPETATREQKIRDGFKSLTFWQFFLASALLRRRTDWKHQNRSDQAEVSYPTADWKPPKDGGYTAEVIEQFLKQGADPYCLIQIVPKEHGMILSILFRDTRIQHVYPLYGKMVPLGHSLSRALNKCLDLRGRPHLGSTKLLSEEFSLREIVAVSDWTNRDSILKLIDSYSEKQSSDQ